MSFITCPGCGFNVSNRTGQCPNCGMEFEGKDRNSAWAEPNPLWSQTPSPKAPDASAEVSSTAVDTTEAVSTEARALPPKPVAVCSSCGLVATKAGDFCAQCGSAMRPVDLETEIEHLQAVVESLQDEVVELRQTVETVSKQVPGSEPPPDFTWAGVRPPERWTVAWGVWWRMTIAFIVLQIVLYFVLLAVIGILTSPN